MLSKVDRQTGDLTSVAGTPANATQVAYNNAVSGINAENVQSALNLAYLYKNKFAETLDLNDLTDIGVYTYGDFNVTTNAPSNFSGVVQVYPVNGSHNYITQIATDLEGVMYKRCKAIVEGNPYWNSWSRINVVDRLADNSFVNLSNEFVKASNVPSLEVYAQRKNNFVTLWITTTVTVNDSSMSTMPLTSSGTLPEKYRPLREFSQSTSGYQGNTNNGYVEGRLIIQEGGTISLGERYLVGAATGGDWIFKWSVTYVV